MFFRFTILAFGGLAMLVLLNKSCHLVNLSLQSKETQAEEEAEKEMVFIG
jgi:hypothetical protein